MTIISPSILSANFADLGSELKAIEQAGADMIHIDIMDGHYVPNISFGHSIMATVKKHTKLPLDVHLMVEQPEKWLEIYAKHGADIITIHPDSTRHLDRSVEQIKAFGCKAGIALLPTEGPEILRYIIDKIDLILVMSVNPGFGGQKFLSSQLDKISVISQMIGSREILLSVDGGINDLTAHSAIEKGANMLVSGSYIFSGDYKNKIASLRAKK